MNEASVEFGISVIIVSLFHLVKRWIPWVEQKTDKALRVVSITVAILSSSFITMSWHQTILSIDLDLPVLVRFVINAAVQHGMSQIYHNIVFKRPPRVIEAVPRMAGPIPFK